VEVLSSSTARAGRGRRRLIYEDRGVPEYWILDLDARQVERWQPDDSRGEVITGALEWRPLPELEPLRIGPPAFFDVVLGLSNKAPTR